MKHKVLAFWISCLCATAVNAQAPVQPQLNPLPLNPKILSGVLQNGMSYYIMHNEEPKERANFYIAQKVGSTLEQPDQLGLAHFLEHMAFNGTTNFPGKNMLNYLQSKGIRFGADINAYTAFDETVYNINNVPTTDPNLMDSVLLVLHDWSGDILLEESEIDAERGVIQEEWRMRNNADIRMYTAILPQIYEEYQYQQMPIGKMDVVMNFKPEALRAYYKKWYRPDQQGIIIVGDFDAKEMEKKVIDLFSTIEMPENAAPRIYPSVSDNKEPIFVSFSDPELTNLMTTISFKSEKIPFELRNTVEIYVQNVIVQDLISRMINTRLTEFALTPECKYIYAGVSFSDFYVSKTKESFNIRVIAKNNSLDAVGDAMSVVARACKTGFTSSEFERASQDMMASMEKALAEKDKTNNGSFGHELCSLFTDNEPAPGIEMEYQLWSVVLPNLKVEALNQLVKDLLTDENMVVVTCAPKADNIEIVAEDAMISNIKNAMAAEYEALEDETIDEPLIDSLPAPGKIVSSVVNEKLGTTELTLSNGIRVVLKPTDFAGDEILFTAFREGGKRVYDSSQASDVLMMEDVYETAKYGPFDSKTLKKYLTGKNVSLGFSVNTYTDVLSGNSTQKDLPYLFELIYTSFVNINPDESAYNVNVNRIRPILENSDKNPQTIFSNQVAKTRFNNNPLMLNPTVKTLDEAVYSNVFSLLKNTLSNAAQYTFIFTGNIEMSTFEPLVEKYIATLPSSSNEKITFKSDFNTPQGTIVNKFNQIMETPSTMVFNMYSGNNLDYSIENEILLDMAGGVLRNIYIETLREEEGGTYSPSASSIFNPNTGEWDVIYLFITNADQQDKLMARADEEFRKLLQNGTDEVNFNKVKESMIKQYEINSRKNRYWDNVLMTQLRFPNVIRIEGYEEVLKNINLAQFNQFLKNLYNGENRIEVIMEGVTTE